MKKSTKAALLSALVFPGAGHIYLKKYTPGAALIGVSCAGLYYLISSAVEQVSQILAQIQSSAVPPDIATITDLVTKSSSSSQGQLMSNISVIITICWIGGIIDAYRLGVKTEKIEAGSGKQSSVN
jgi:TM2 domain-containing membrane protein YozV